MQTIEDNALKFHMDGNEVMRFTADGVYGYGKKLSDENIVPLFKQFLEKAIQKNEFPRPGGKKPHVSARREPGDCCQYWDGE